MARRRVSSRKPLGQVLLEAGHLAPDDLLKALAMQARQQVRLGDILLAHGMVSEDNLMDGLARQWRAAVIDPVAAPPDPRLIDILGPAECLSSGVLPWRRAGGVTVVATARPEMFEQMRARLSAAFGPVALALVAERDLHAAVLTIRHRALNHRAETRVPEALSCRRRQLANMQAGLGGGRRPWPWAG